MGLSAKLMLTFMVFLFIFGLFGLISHNEKSERFWLTCVAVCFVATLISLLYGLWIE
jgi:putative effector of murein hydrolase LrgA (UPF0299 family)